MKLQKRTKIIIASVSGGLFLFVWWWFDPGHDWTERLESLHCRSEDQIIRQFGPPDYRYEHTLNLEETLPEYAIEIHNTYSPNDPKTNGVVIRELRWDYFRYHIALFLHEKNGEWQVFHSLRWKEGVQF